jgi:hypothetical protein
MDYQLLKKSYLYFQLPIGPLYKFSVDKSIVLYNLGEEWDGNEGTSYDAEMHIFGLVNNNPFGE